MDLVNQIEEKCRKEGFVVNILERTSQTLESDKRVTERKHKSLEVQIPEERDYKRIIINENVDLKKIVDTPFEKFRFLKGYKAVWSTELSVLECEIDSPERLYFLSWESDIRDNYLFIRNISLFDEVTLQEPEKRWTFPSPSKNVKIWFGEPSIEFQILQGLQPMRKSSSGWVFTLRIEGVKIESHDHAKQVMLKLGNAILFQIDLVKNVPVHLALDQPFKEITSSKLVGTNVENKFSSPKFEYDEEPMKLYQYARSSSEMPLLQYLAFYQILEFYFPLYALKETQQKIKNHIKSPLFDVNKDTDVAHIIELVQSTGRGKSLGDERSQIKATIQNIIDKATLEAFFNERSSRRDFFDQQKKNKGVARQKINFSNFEHDIRIDVAQRIYEIRCKVVHAKDDEQYELLLPYSPELSQMAYDLELIQFLAQKALIAASRPLRL